ncbi:hypothetical protein N7537_011698 [Penicillium hordei]|uniref:Uncharacterized protein n=1 Tax=Penicillium hordei TaxID=40994 RepID=A0AAD6GUB2_9EURO|nr:uncharacterized protein N7537_011698 [Penicillium hordei]KAJ5589020.1 hypothetical protein N7537_011698 [Penicillium hordei]
MIIYYDIVASEDIFQNILGLSLNKSPWRNWLARPTVNREVGSSSLPGDVVTTRNARDQLEKLANVNK